MATFNQSIFDSFGGEVGDAWPAQHPSTIAPENQDSSTDAGMTAGIACVSFVGAVGVIASVLAALRRRVDFVASLCDRIVTVFEALAWRQGTAPVPPIDPEAPPAPVVPAGRNLSDDSLIQLRRLASQCAELRPDHEYL